MRIRRKVTFAAALTLLLAACGGSDDGDAGGSGTAGGEAEPVVDGTFTTAVAADPGNLHPHLTVLAATRAIDNYLYDKLVYFTVDGEELPWLAESWEVTTDTVTYTLRDGVTCSDGTPLTASDVAANFQFVVDDANVSPVRGVLVPAAMTATADDAARTVTITVPAPDPFLLQSTGDLFIACRAGLDDPSLLEEDGIGTGMFELTEVARDDHYTFQRRDDYTWGPDGITAADPGTPATVDIRVIANESTAANLLLSGELNAASVVGPDRQRLEQTYEEVSLRAVVGELFFNQAAGNPGADDAVRAALAQALDFEELMSVITGGYGQRSEALAVIDPVACRYDAVDGNLPEHDADAAAAALDAAGWTAGSDGVRAQDGTRLELELIYNSTRGDTTAAAAELIASTWTELGVAATTRGLPPTEYNEVVFGTGAWGAALLPVNLRLPNQMVPFLSGATPADGGVNLASIDNPEYAAAVAEAMTLPGQEGCDKWMEAEQALFAANDVLLFADETIPLFLDGVTVERGGDGPIPATIRLSAP
ncbi:ABC transporter substrate-binding protein [Jiangella alkaliphila]|uniref:Peptide/nickel transport system substrate-binding protein n=1 Tax=Jiangella alkaliphila TaxID=419479 RepID=A0A1H2JNW1_9ACTN|nr:ABC transporter substrate-binding protein [Jiangella alkaliphila]SDU58032.1 peptide/nickel transport system substrate-binding protein [Jiangella alkaliphila]